MIRIRGWGRDSDRIGLVIYWWAWAGSFPLVVMFVRGSGFYWVGDQKVVG